MKRCMTCVGALLVVGLLVSCGGGGGDSPSGGSTSAPPSAGSPPAPGGGNPPPSDPPASNPPAGNPPTAGNPPSSGTPPSTTPPPPPVTARFEESDATQVTMSAGWTPSDGIAGWSGGAAVQSTVAGATVSFTFTGTSVRWIGSRGRGMGIASVNVDGGPAKEVDLFARPNEEIRTPVVTFYDLSDGQHTLTITVTGRKNREATSNVVVVDAFEVAPQIVSHYQDADPDLAYSGSWDVDTRFGWSGSGVSNPGDPPVGARVTESAGAKVTLKFRGTSITWRGYRGPDAGIAAVQVDKGKAEDVDTYAETIKVQDAVFTASGLTDANHTLTITATGRKNGASSAAKIFVDAFDVTTPGRRYEDEDRSMISYVGSWNPRNDARVWSEGTTHMSNQAMATA